MGKGMEKSKINQIRYRVVVVLQWMAVITPLSLVCIMHSALPVDETVGQWVWFDKMAIVSAVCILLSILLTPKKIDLSFSTIVSWSLIILGCVEAVWGLRQLYGFASSNHVLYALTGSFFNPGPYSGYLALILPICLHQWLACRERVGRLISCGVMLLILCVLPAGMSRSAWLAAGFSCLWVYGCLAHWGEYIREMWWLHKGRVVGSIAGVLCIMIVGGCLAYSLKPDSARGRLFMWKITCHSIADRPLLGYGTGNFAAAYGDAQEAYFATGDYKPWEEHVAGSPEYAFNEYFQVAVEYGLFLSVCVLGAVLMCLYVGVRKKRYGICGAIFSLMIFSFSSYPLQLPVFIVTFGGLLLACILGSNRWEWFGLAILVGTISGFRLKSDLGTEQACKEWMNARILYNVGAYESAEKDYERLYPLLKDRAAFLFEYGHGLHKQQKFESSNRILREALKRSCDSMILNILGKNSQQSGDYLAAEDWYIRSTHRLPGRIYPYYLLAKLYAEPGFKQREKFEKMKQMVLTKEPKVNSTAIRQMREEVNKISVTTPF